jgi:deoxyribodipyrimidine photo-lyase
MKKIIIYNFLLYCCVSLFGMEDKKGSSPSKAEVDSCLLNVRVHYLMPNDKEQLCTRNFQCARNSSIASLKKQIAESVYKEKVESFSFRASKDGRLITLDDDSNKTLAELKITNLFIIQKTAPSEQKNKKHLESGHSMVKKYLKSLFIFRRDLRLYDNSGLIKALAESKSVIPCFIFDPKQVGEKNTYRSQNAIQFMVESLQDLNEQLEKHNGTLFLFYGDPHQIVKDLIKEEEIDAVFCNRDYTPFSIKRDEAIKHVCATHNVAFEQTNDLLLHQPEDVKTGSGTPYSVFTAFYKNAHKIPIAEPRSIKDPSFYTHKIKNSSHSSIYKKIMTEENTALAVRGGTTRGLHILKNLAHQEHYSKERDFPALDSTSHLSSHLKFGTLSIRQVYHSMGKTLGYTHPLLRQLFWRDFFTHVAYHSSFVFGSAYHEKYNAITWENNRSKFNAWREGLTGFPIVDAGMRQLNTTGFMHNRVRMIVASFLVKDLHIDWQWGEQYFAQQLVDYDPCVNNGNWQWAASTGCDAQPYFRIFNPWLQQQKFDPDCIYIKKWVPELQGIPAKIIHALHKQDGAQPKGYPRPICDHAQESALAKKIYKAC